MDNAALRKKIERIGRECVRELTNPEDAGTVTLLCHMPRNGFPRGRVIGQHTDGAPIRQYKADALLAAVQQYMKRNPIEEQANG